jgi:hypothetical protein
VHLVQSAFMWPCTCPRTWVRRLVGLAALGLVAAATATRLLVASDSTTAAASRLAARCSDRCRVEDLAHQPSLSSARRRLPLLTAIVVTLTLRASGGSGMRSATAVVSLFSARLRASSPTTSHSSLERAMRHATRPGRGVLVADRADCGDCQLATHVLTQHRARPSRRRPWRWRVRCAPGHPASTDRQSETRCRRLRSCGLPDSDSAPSDGPAIRD